MGWQQKWASGGYELVYVDMLTRGLAMRHKKAENVNQPPTVDAIASREWRRLLPVAVVRRLSCVEPIMEHLWWS